MKQMTDERINGIWDEMWDELEDKHGSPFAVPVDERNAVSERLRALNVLQLWQRESQTTSLVAFLNAYSITEDAQSWLIDNHASGAVRERQGQEPAGKPQSRKKKWAAFLKAVKEQAGKEFTTEQLTELSGFSYPATLAFVKNEPTFIKVKKGLWRISSS